SRWLPRFGVETTLVSATEPEAFARAMRPNTRLVYLESPTNPLIRLIDLEPIVALARERKLLTVIDSTFATPINQRPLDWGVDVVIHSATKYLAGHSDVLGGVVCGSRSFIARAKASGSVALTSVVSTPNRGSHRLNRLNVPP
ncbi:MAG: aminotransferase class V-fold PLP-dependent enzyme, partial [Acidobacteria bacterium]